MRNISSDRKATQPTVSSALTGLCLLTSLSAAAGLTVGCDQGERMYEPEDRDEVDDCCDGNPCLKVPYLITTVEELKACRTLSFVEDLEDPHASDGEYTQNDRTQSWNADSQNASGINYHFGLIGDAQETAVFYQTQRLYDADKDDWDHASFNLWSLEDDGSWKNPMGQTLPGRVECTNIWSEPHRGLQETCGNGVLDGNEFCDSSAPSGLTCEGLGGLTGTFQCPSDCSMPTVEASGCSVGPLTSSVPLQKVTGETFRDALEALFGSSYPSDVFWQRHGSNGHDTYTFAKSGHQGVVQFYTAPGSIDITKTIVVRSSVPLSWVHWKLAEVGTGKEAWTSDGWFNERDSGEDLHSPDVDLHDGYYWYRVGGRFARPSSGPHLLGVLTTHHQEGEVTFFASHVYE